MTWRFKYEDEATKHVNLLPANHVECVFNLKRALKAAGWVVTASGTGSGLAFDTTADIITTAAAGAGGLDNPSAWFQIRDPNSVCWLSFQRDTTASAGNAYQWRVTCSTVAFAVTASASATRACEITGAPDTTKQKTILGGGTEAAPTYAQLFYSTAGSNRQNIVADATTGSFLCVLHRNGRAGAEMTYIVFDKLAASASASDPSPWVFNAKQSSDPFLYTNWYGASVGPWKNILNGTRGWFQVTPAFWSMYGGTSTPSNFGVNPEDSKDNPSDVLYGRPSSLAAPCGLYGKSQVFKWGTIARSFGDRLSVDTTGDHVIINDVAVPWNGDAVTI